MDYIKEELIGRGGMSDVFRGRALSDRAVPAGTSVALKYLHTRFAGEPEFQERFYREAKICNDLHHPNIVRVVDVDLDGSQPVMVMELLRGQTLRFHLQSKGSLPEAEALGIAIEILKALEAAHDKGIVHRDIKPGNIMLDHAGIGQSPGVKVMDFGIARPSDSTITVLGTELGAPEYMSPEQMRGDRPDGRSDLYSLGIALYEMLSGQTPFNGNYSQVRNGHLQSAAPALSGAISARTRAAISTALEKDRDKRFPNARHMRGVLEMALPNRSELKSPHSPPPTTPPLPPPPPPAPPWIWFLLGAAFLIVVTLAAGGGGHSPVTAPTSTAFVTPTPTPAQEPEPTMAPTAIPTLVPVILATPAPQPTSTPVPSPTALPLPAATPEPLPSATPVELPIRVEKAFKTRPALPKPIKVRRTKKIRRGNRRIIRRPAISAHKPSVVSKKRGSKQISGHAKRPAPVRSPY